MPRKMASVTLEAVEGGMKKMARGEDVEEENGGFFSCYLLASLSPRYKGRTYIGFTVNPRRRIRQHNGEIPCGAWRTKHGRPWQMVLCIYGFPSNVNALQFEWAWQHPLESLAVRKAASASFKSSSGVAKQIKLALTMMALPSWESLNLTVNFFSTKYMNYAAGCLDLPKHMKVTVSAMDELPFYLDCGSVDVAGESEDAEDEEGDQMVLDWRRNSPLPDCPQQGNSTPLNTTRFYSQIEVIDLVTPSSCKARHSRTSDVIDLTEHVGSRSKELKKFMDQLA